MNTPTIIKVLSAGFNQQAGYFQAYVRLSDGSQKVESIDVFLLSQFIQNEGTCIGRKYGANLSLFRLHCPTPEYFNQVVLNYQNEPVTESFPDEDDAMVDLMVETCSDAMYRDYSEQAPAKPAYAPRMSAKDMFMMDRERWQMGNKNYFERQK